MKNGKPIVVSYETAEAKQYKKEFTKIIEKELKQQNWNYDETGLKHIYVDAVFYFDRIDKDANNYWKCLLDCITDTKKIWKDDNIVCERVQGIYYDSKNPRIELEIHPVDYIGIFKNKNELEDLENKCKTCSRYIRNCSILKKAKTGKVQEDIVDLQCKKYKCINKGG